MKSLLRQGRDGPYRALGATDRLAVPPLKFGETRLGRSPDPRYSTRVEISAQRPHEYGVTWQADTKGKVPKDSRLSRPARKYLMRHAMRLAGVTPNSAPDEMRRGTMVSRCVRRNVTGCGRCLT